jgi:hypothetical protein
MFSPGIILVVCRRERAYVPLKLIDIETGTVSRTSSSVSGSGGCRLTCCIFFSFFFFCLFTQIFRDMSVLLKQLVAIEVIELFNGHLLIKQQNEPLRIIDVSHTLFF